MWDIKPQGYENVTAEQAKLSGSLSCLYVLRRAMADLMI